MNSKRTQNFTESERSILIKLSNMYKTIIECKRTDATTWREKEEMWRKVEVKFNASTTGPPRTAKQLKNKYEAIKKELKKQFAKHRSYVIGTGGGNYISPPTPKSEEEKILVETIAMSLQGLQNCNDSDGLAGVSGINSSSQIFDNIEGESVVDDWTPPNTKLLRTPVNPILRQPLLNRNEVNNEDCVDVSLDHSHVSIPDTDVIHDTEVETELEKKNEKRQSQSKAWSSRRRPVLAKKKCMSSAAAKFETLAEQKSELVALEIKIAQEQLIYNKREHEERMKILDLQRQIEEKKLNAINISTV